MNESDKTYYYASAGGQATGPVSKQELRKLLEQHIIHESANVIRKGDAQWRRLSDILPPQGSPYSLAPFKQKQKFHALAKGEVGKGFLPILLDTYAIAFKNF